MVEGVRKAKALKKEYGSKLLAAGFDVARTGVASVGFIGFPSVGKSTLMSKLTGQHSEGLAPREMKGVRIC